MALSGRSDSKYGTQWQSDALRGNHLEPAKMTWLHQAIRGNQRQSEAISGNHLEPAKMTWLHRVHRPLFPTGHRRDHCAPAEERREENEASGVEVKFSHRSKFGKEGALDH